MKIKCVTDNFLKKGFTLVELLIVIAILGILAAGIVVVINPMEKINSANLAKAKTFAAGVENSLVMSQVGKWSFNDQVSPGLDTSGYGNIGTLNGGAVWQTSAQCGLELGGCLKFDGTGYVNLGNSASLQIANTVSIEGWVKQIVAPTTIGAWFGNGYTDVGSIFLGYHSSYPISWWVMLPGPVEWSFGTRTLNAWIHLVITLDLNLGSNQLKAYQNGVLVNQRNWTSDIMTISATRYIGRSRAGNYWNGFIDEVKIYNKALLSYQIQQIYARGLVKHLLALK